MFREEESKCCLHDGWTMILQPLIMKVPYNDQAGSGEKKVDE
jgi:hypothetical protein